MKQEWRPIKGYEGRYEVSNFGGIKRMCGGKGVKNPILSPGVMQIGYRMVVLSKGTIKTRKRYYIHRLVAAAFLGECPKGHVVNHKDADKLNNHVSNLEYVPQWSNVRHAARLGLHKMGVRSSDHIKLSEQDIKEIRDLRGYLTVRELAKSYGVGNGHISNIQNGKSWEAISLETFSERDMQNILRRECFKVGGASEFARKNGYIQQHIWAMVNDRQYVTDEIGERLGYKRGWIRITEAKERDSMGLKVYGMSPAGKERYICAARDNKEASKIFGVSISAVRKYAAITGNEKEIALALTEPQKLILSPVQ